MRNHTVNFTRVAITKLGSLVLMRLSRKEVAGANPTRLTIDYNFHKKMDSYSTQLGIQMNPIIAKCTRT